jgi:IS5 family transposase
MSNRFERTEPDFVDLAIKKLKKPKTFLDKIVKFVDWEPIKDVLLKKLKRKPDVIGNPAYPPLSMFKILLLQRWYDLSDREMDDALTDRISFRRFVNFSFNYDTPNFTTICRFRNSLIKYSLDKKLFDLLNRQLQKHGLIIKKGAIIDASIITSSRRPRKSITLVESTEEISDPLVKITYSGDVEAKWTVKAGKPYYGYKIHVGTDPNFGLILGGHTTPANFSDTKELMAVVNESKIAKGTLIFADKGYDSLKNRELLRGSDYKEAIMYKAHKNKPLTEMQRKINSKISSVRARIERTFGTLKRGYGFCRTRYLGCAKVNEQFLLSAIAFNLKKACMFAV